MILYTAQVSQYEVQKPKVKTTAISTHKAWGFAYAGAGTFHQKKSAAIITKICRMPIT